MSIKAGDKLPQASFTTMGAEGPEPVTVSELCAGKTVALFAVPGAFTPTCHLKHLPSFVETAEALKAKGVDTIACVSVNDPFVMKAWGETTGASGAGILMLSDAEAAFTKAIGLDFSAPPVGLIDRSQRYAMVVKDGVVEAINVEGSPGEATTSTGQAVLELL
ncbi:peroxiredoxin [Rhodovulum sp. DZ06]|uniref:peroxiredoxin n=1 Tax=Rhodovulum sp. DZ06 TaxID=3425126 RepID=UPI003D34ABEA